MEASTYTSGDPPRKWENTPTPRPVSREGDQPHAGPRARGGAYGPGRPRPGVSSRSRAGRFYPKPPRLQLGGRVLLARPPKTDRGRFWARAAPHPPRRPGTAQGHEDPGHVPHHGGSARG